MNDSDILLSRPDDAPAPAQDSATPVAPAPTPAAAAELTPAAPPPGGRLRAGRESRNWNLIDTAEKLHLEPTVVQALEENDFAKLGPAVFAKGHLRQYATLLGLPVAEMLAAYEELQRRPAAVAAAAPASKAGRASLPMSAPPVAAPDDEQHTPFPDVAVPAWYSRLPSWTLPAAAGALLIIIAAGALWWWKPWQQGSPQLVQNSQGAAIAPSLEQPPAPVSPIVESAPGASPGASGANPASMAAGSSPSAGAAPAVGAAAAPASSAGRLRLRLSFSADSWVEVRDAAGAMVYRGKGAANSVKVISGAAPLNVFLGSVSGVQLEINNHAVAIGPQFVRGEKARFEAGADGVLRRGPRT